MGIVIKRNGTSQTFNPSKIRASIQKSSKDAGISASRTKEILDDVAKPVIDKYKDKKVKALYLRRIILRRLDRKSKSVASSWRRYDKKRRR